MNGKSSQLVGVLLVIIPMLMWILSSFLGAISLPESHFATLIWAGVSLLLGYNVKDGVNLVLQSSNGGHQKQQDNDESNNRNQGG